MSIRSLIVSALLILLPAVANAADPLLSVTESNLGTWNFEGVATEYVVLDVAANDDLNFSWLGDASGYEGTILGYRYGWDIVDPDDPSDPGWMTAGYVADLLAAPTVSFSSGFHTLHVEAMDADGGLTRAWIALVVSPVVPVEARSWGHLKAGFRLNRPGIAGDSIS